MPETNSSLEAFHKLLALPEPPRLGPQSRAGIRPAAELERALAEFFLTRKTPDRIQPSLRSAALLWHDHLDASHAISQNIETRGGSWLHGIMHRREPDYGNAKYWFRRVGQHDAFPELARRTAEFLRHDSDDLTRRLIENGEWMPFAFIDDCERVEASGNAKEQGTLRRIQALEFDVLVEHIFGLH